jgi:hypothetical protein
MFKRHLTLIFKVDILLRDPPEIGNPASRPCVISNNQDAVGAGTRTICLAQGEFPHRIPSVPILPDGLSREKTAANLVSPHNP